MYKSFHLIIQNVVVKFFWEFTWSYGATAVTDNLSKFLKRFFYFKKFETAVIYYFTKEKQTDAIAFIYVK